MKVQPIFLAYGAAALVGVYLVTRAAQKVAQVAPGIVSGNNAVTQNQTNAAGQRTTAYQGAGVLGTLGAGFNSASGGVFASIGESLGGWAFDTFGSKPAAPRAAPRVAPPVDPRIADRWDAYTVGGQRSATGSGSFDPWGLYSDSSRAPTWEVLSGTGFAAEYVAP